MEKQTQRGVELDNRYASVRFKNDALDRFKDLADETGLDYSTLLDILVSHGKAMQIEAHRYVLDAGNVVQLVTKIRFKPGL